MSALAISLTDVLQRPDIWRGDAIAAAPSPGLPTGFPTLDVELPGGGWPRGQLTELLHAHTGIGELSLLLPAVAQLTRENRPVVLVLPPQRHWQVHAPAWTNAGVQLNHLLLVSVTNARDSLWAAVESLRCSEVAATLLWPDAGTQRGAGLPVNSLRRLQTAASEGGGCAFLLRPAVCAPQASPAPLRLSLTPAVHGLRVDLLKRRGRAPSAPLYLPVVRPRLMEKPRHALARTGPASTLFASLSV
jgi:hypothetical protein